MVALFMLPAGLSAQSVTVRNEHLSVGLALDHGLTLTSIRDEVTGHEYISTPTFLFEFAVNNGTPYQSNNGLVIDTSTVVSPSQVVVTAHGALVPIDFALTITAPTGEVAAVVRASVTNRDSTDAFLRTVFPKVRGIVAPGDPARTMGTVPQEIGSTVPLRGGPLLGMPFNIDVGLPTAMNTMDVASIYDPSGGGGLFFADVEGNLDDNVAPIQFNLSALEVAGFWITNLSPGERANVPALAIGVHHSGDWHHAVDYYVSQHRPRWTFPAIPAWFRDQGAMYAFAGGGAGGIYLDLPLANINDRALWTAFEANNGPWSPQLPISNADFAPAGARIAAVRRNSKQEDVFVVANDGAIWSTFEFDNGPWSAPFRLTPTNFAPPGGTIAAVLRNPNHEDVFVVANDGAIWSIFELNDGPWSAPLKLSANLAAPGRGIAAVLRNPNHEDVFVVGTDGGIWSVFELNDGPWSPPFQAAGAGLAPPGADIGAVLRNPNHEDVFVVGGDGAIWSIFELNDGPWSPPLRLTSPGLAPAGAHLAAIVRNDHQEDVFVVGADGGVWSTFEVNDSAWNPPFRVTNANFAPAGGNVTAVLRNPSQEDVFVIGLDGALWSSFELNDGPWSPPVLLSSGNFAPAGGGIAAAARNGSQEDAFVVGSGRLRSFRDLPQLLDEARALGTNVIYLWDYWEGTLQGGYPPYWNKGDYIPRSDLGGRDALIAGIQGVHNNGGRIIVYLEPFIIYQYSQIGLQQGLAWGGRDVFGNLYAQYPGNYSMVAPSVTWQDYVVAIAQRLVGEYGVDGIFLDSWGWQMNWPMHTASEGRFYSPKEYSRGVLSLADRVRTAIRAIKSDAVVIGETTSGVLGQHWDGGTSADFSFKRDINQGRITASPVRYGIPEINYITNGRNLNEFNQVYASGHNLALCCYFPGSFMWDNSNYVQALVALRQQYKDALIYGRQAYQPATGSDAVAAYVYRGSPHQIIAVVNTSDTTAYSGDLTLSNSEANSTWRELLIDEIMSTHDRTQLHVALDPGSLSLLLKETGCAGDCSGDHMVTVDEIIIGVNIALGMSTPDACSPFDVDGDGAVTVDEIIAAVNNVLAGCG